jgi:hypothetical protein
MYQRPYASAADRDALGRMVSNLIRSLGTPRSAPVPPRRFSHRRGDGESTPRAEQLTLG